MTFCSIKPLINSLKVPLQPFKVEKNDNLYALYFECLPIFLNSLMKNNTWVMFLAGSIVSPLNCNFLTLVSFFWHWRFTILLFKHVQNPLDAPSGGHWPNCCHSGVVECGPIGQGKQNDTQLVRRPKSRSAPRYALNWRADTSKPK